MIKTKKIRSRAGKTIYPAGTGEQEVQLTAPDRVRMPNVQIMGPSSVGMLFLISSLEELGETREFDNIVSSKLRIS